MKYTTLGNLISPASVIRCKDNDYPVLSMTMHDGIVLQSDRFKKSLASTDTSEYKVVNHGQLVVGFPIDEGVLYIQKAAPKGIMSPAYNVWNVDCDNIYPDYLELCLHSPQSMMYYKSKLRGTTARRRSIATADLLALPICMPSIETQIKTVAIISKVNQLLDNCQQQLETLDALVKSRFIEMFGEPEFNTKDLPVVCLSDLCEVGSSKRIYQSEQSMTGIPFLRISDLVTLMDTGELKADLYIPENRYRELKIQGLVPNPGDILVTSRGTLGRCYIVRDTDDFYFQDGMISWLSKFSGEVMPLYIQYLFAMDGLRKQIDGLQAGSTVAYLSISMLKKLKIMLPSLELQEQFAAFVQATDKSKLYDDLEVAA